MHPPAHPPAHSPGYPSGQPPAYAPGQPVRQGPPWPPPAPARQSARGRLVVLGACLAGLAGVIMVFAANLPAVKTGTMADRGDWKVAPVAKMFPATLQAWGDLGPPLSRAGVAPAASCAQALTPAMLQSVQAFGCERVVTATYVSRDGWLVGTVGMVVLDRSAGPNPAIFQEDATRPPLIHAVGFPGTPAAGFADDRVFGSGMAAQTSGLYLFVSAVGWADGRKRQAFPAPWNTARIRQAETVTYDRIADAMASDVRDFGVGAAFGTVNSGGH